MHRVKWVATGTRSTNPFVDPVYSRLCLTTAYVTFRSRDCVLALSTIISFTMSAEDEQATSEIKKLSLSDIASWDDYYDNPKAEIVLVSNDKIGFRADAWQFKKRR